jgi:hypothetical protein
MVRLEGEAESVKFPAAAAFTVSPTVVVCFKLPQVPVMVTVTVPVVAVPLAVNVRTLELVVGFVPNAAVTPVGKPDAVSVTLLLNPLVGLTVMVLVPPAPPCVIVTLFGDADKLKFGVTAALTVSDTLVVCVKLPEVPEMVTVAVPVVALLLADSVRTLVVLVGGFGANVAVTPDGKPEAERVTLPLNPLVGLIVIVLVPAAPPCVTVTLPGEGDKLKFGVEDVGQLFTRLATFTLPLPEAKSQPVVVA